MTIEAPETEKGKILRELAEATDRAEAFRGWQPPAMATLIIDQILRTSPKPGVEHYFGGCVDHVIYDWTSEILAEAQARLDAKVEELHARFGVLMDDAGHAAQPLPIRATQRSVSENRRAKAATATKTRRR